MVKNLITSGKGHLLLHRTIFESQRFLAIHTDQMMMVMVETASLKLLTSIQKIKLLQNPHLAKHAKVAINGIEAHARIFHGHLVIDVFGRQISLVARENLSQRSALVGNPPTVPRHRSQHFLTQIMIRHCSPVPFPIIDLIFKLLKFDFDIEQSRLAHGHEHNDDDRPKEHSNDANKRIADI
jgi:hypothetical protein